MAKSKPKSNRGGKRPGAGRKTTAAAKLREDFNLVATDTLIDFLPDCLANLKRLADGVKARNAKGIVYDVLPSAVANMYLLDRLLGKPKQAVEHSGKDGGAIPLTLYLPDNGRDHREPDPAQAQLPAPGDVPGVAG